MSILVKCKGRTWETHRVSKIAFNSQLCERAFYSRQGTVWDHLFQENFVFHFSMLAMSFDIPGTLSKSSIFTGSLVVIECHWARNLFTIT
uniref:Uncharacterized protein n=1 Tax=Manihot esculenta TaxID=3983 RepID=A0A2C9V0F8_MANES